MKTFKISNAAELWQRDTSLPSIPTFSQNLDNILGNDGIQLGGLTELLGLPGTGKTQLCLQSCASVQVPKILGGLNSESLYIDTNTNFTPYRFREILNAGLQRCQQLVPSVELNEEEALKKLHYVRAFGLEKFCAFMQRMPKFIADHPNKTPRQSTNMYLKSSHKYLHRVTGTQITDSQIRLIVIDSIAFPFKEGIPVKQRTGLLFRQMAELQRIAVDNQIAVVVTNEMSTRVGLPGGAVVGALGDAWAHRCNTRLLLTTRVQGPRLALIVKSNATTNAVAEFQITKDGIRDIN